LTTNKGKITTADVLVYRIWGTGGATNKIEHSVTYTGTTSKLYHNGDTASANTIGIAIVSPAGKVTSDAPGLDTTATPAIDGKVMFEFDFASANASGTYSAPLGDALRITATGI